MPGVCNCTIGPGPHGCSACGAPGWQWSPPPVPAAQPQPVIVTLPARLTREDAEAIRQIIREETGRCTSRYTGVPCMRRAGHKGTHYGEDARGELLQWS